MSTEFVTAQCRQGQLAGITHEGIHRFAGIPYAGPVSGPGRFRPPLAPPAWEGVRDASGFGPIAPQVDMMATLLGLEPQPQNEDCLFLNVFTPGTDDGARPVMVWIHGGAYSLGSGSEPGYDGTVLASTGDVVVVTINYRLGALGYMYLGDAFPGSGNLGVLDHIAALEWVRDNVAGFGGDPENVTIFGESAGAMSVGTLLGTPAARGLFHKAVLQSGAAHNVSSPAAASEVTSKMMAALGVATVAELGELPADAIVSAQQSFMMKAMTDIDGSLDGYGSAMIPFQPVVDGEVLPVQPIDAVRAGAAAGIPVLIGTCRDEWNLFNMMDSAEMTDELLHTRLDKVFPSGVDAVEMYSAAMPGAEPKALFAAVATDLIFRAPSHELTQALIEAGSTVYSYLFTWPSPMLGACHAIDLPFVFGNVTGGGMAMLTGGQAPKHTVDAVLASWLAFARTGNPSNDVIGSWPQYDLDQRATMRIDAETEVVNDPESERRQFFATLG